MSATERELTVYVGCYTTADRKGRGEGISAFRMDGESGAWREVGVVAKVANPSFLAVHPNKRFLYSVHGGQLSEVSAFAIKGGTGQLDQLGTWPSGGVNPVHLDLHPGGRWMVVANYTGGTAALLPVKADGCPGDISDLVTLSGTPGPDPVEQSTPHPHDIPFDPTGAFVCVPDKGLDRVFVYRVDTERGKYVAADPPSVASAAGAGPRHVAFHPRQRWAFVINELNTTITAYTFDRGGGGFCDVQTLSSLPSDGSVTGRNTGSEIVVHPSGRFVFVSNRGHNSVGVFEIQETGTLTSVGWYPTDGDTPRSIAVDPSGRFLYAANQMSDSIVGFKVNAATGELSATGQVVHTGSPSTMVFVGPQ